ncbi:MAG: SHOCT domain-containing protein [Pseudomonadota bacterium]
MYRSDEIGYGLGVVKRFTALVLSIGFFSGSALAAQPNYLDEYSACADCKRYSAVWRSGEFDQMYFATDTTPGVNLHPISVPVDLLTRAFSLLKYKTRTGSTESLLGELGAISLAKGLTTALTTAKANDDVTFMVVTKSDSGLSGLFASAVGNSGRAFVDQNGLNIIFGEAHVEFVGRYRSESRVRSFNFGSRSKASTVAVSAEGLTQNRSDWVIIPANLLQRGGLLSNFSGAAELLPQHVPGLQTLQAAPAAAPIGVLPQPGPLGRDENYFRAQEERLKTLKRMRDQDLIADDEYQLKRKEILKDF